MNLSLTMEIIREGTYILRRIDKDIKDNNLNGFSDINNELIDIMEYIINHESYKFKILMDILNNGNLQNPFNDMMNMFEGIVNKLLKYPVSAIRQFYIGHIYFIIDMCIYRVATEGIEHKQLKPAEYMKHTEDIALKWRMYLTDAEVLNPTLIKPYSLCLNIFYREKLTLELLTILYYEDDIDNNILTHEVLYLEYISNLLYCYIFSTSKKSISRMDSIIYKHYIMNCMKHYMDILTDDNLLHKTYNMEIISIFQYYIVFMTSKSNSLNANINTIFRIIEFITIQLIKLGDECKLCNFWISSILGKNNYKCFKHYLNNNDALINKYEEYLSQESFLNCNEMDWQKYTSNFDKYMYISNKIINLHKKHCDAYCSTCLENEYIIKNNLFEAAINRITPLESITHINNLHCLISMYIENKKNTLTNNERKNLISVIKKYNYKNMDIMQIGYDYEIQDILINQIYYIHLYSQESTYIYLINNIININNINKYKNISPDNQYIEHILIIFVLKWFYLYFDKNEKLCLDELIMYLNNLKINKSLHKKLLARIKNIIAKYNALYV